MTTNASAVRTNPYIGPRSFETGERLYGRDSELRNLLHLLIAERIVLLHSPSGAGKSSLIKAALIPALTNKRFLALPSIRVNQELPPGAPPEANRYVYSALLSLEERRPPEQRLPLAALAGQSLAGYLKAHVLPEAAAAGSDPVLIFDQFEEVLTVELLNQAAKHAFFQQLGEALADKQLWALLAMREDYLAALAPYLAPIPGRLKDTFRLDLLGVAAAQQAMRGPAQAAGVEFTPEAAERLADELRRSTVQRPDGSTEQVLGPYVEPVQLQVVCLRLWDRLFASEDGHAPLVSLDDIAEVGDVDSALAGYYVERLRAAAAATGVEERAIRDWFDRELITAQGQRGQVMREAGSSGGLDNAVIARLIDAHLVRGDERHGTTWYELAHDRLVAPIQQNNAAWRASVLTPFQQQALLWEEQGRPDGLLLQGEPLREGEAWAVANAAALTEAERAFLEACRKSRAVQEQQVRARRRFQQLIGVSLVAVVAVGLAVFALRQRQIAQEQSKIAQIRRLEALALVEQAEHPQRSLLMSLLSLKNLDTSDSLYPEMVERLRALLSKVSGTPLRGHASAVSHALFSKDGRWLVTADHTSVRFWRPGSWDQSAFVWRSPGPTISALALSADSRWAVAGFDDGAIRLWQLDDPQREPRLLPQSSSAVDMLAFNPDSRWLASAKHEADALYLYQIDTLNNPPKKVVLSDSRLLDISFSPSGQFIVLKSNGGIWGNIRVYSFNSSGNLSFIKDEIEGDFVDFSPDNTFFAVTKANRLILSPVGEGSRPKNPAYIWNANVLEKDALHLTRQGANMNRIAFSRDSHWIAGAASDGITQLWNTKDMQSNPVLLTGTSIDPNTVIFSPDGRLVVTGDSVGDVRIWFVDTPNTPAITLKGHERSIQAIDISPDSLWMSTIGNDGTIRIWRTNTPDQTPIVLRGQSGLVSFHFKSDMRTIQTNGLYGMQLWNISTPEKSPDSFIDKNLQKSYFDMKNATFATGGFAQPLFSPNFQWMLIEEPNAPGAISIYSVANQSKEDLLLPDYGSIKNTSFDGKWLISSDDSGIKLWSMDTLPPKIEGQYTGISITDAKFSPDAQLLAIAESNKGITLFRLNNGSYIFHKKIPENGKISSIFFNEHGEKIAVITEDNVIVQDINEKHQNRIKIPIKNIDRVSFSPNEKYIVLYNSLANNPGQLWDISNTNKPSKTSSIPPMFKLIFSPDSKWLAGEYNEMNIWSIKNGQIHLQKTIKDVIHFDFSPNGSWMSTSNLKGVQLWDLTHIDAQPTAINAERVYTTGFSPDSRFLVTINEDSAQLWPTGPQEIINLACATAGRNLSIDEWRDIAGQDSEYQKVCDMLPYHPSVYQDLLVRGQTEQALHLYQQEQTSDSSAEPPAAWLVRVASELIYAGTAGQSQNPVPIDEALFAKQPSIYREQALAAFATAERLDPQLTSTSSEALMVLCGLGAQTTRGQQVLHICDRAVQSSPKNSVALIMRSTVRGKAGDLAGARSDLEAAQALSSDPNDQLFQQFSPLLEQLKAGQNPFATPTPEPALAP